MRKKMSQYQSYIHTSRYARWLPDECRRETWTETVSRYIEFFSNRGQIDQPTSKELHEAIESMQVMPSMRALMTAGKALDRDNMAGFNCSYVAIDHPRAFDEILYVLMCGTGVGFSVERQSIAKLPEVSEEFFSTDTTISVRDSKLGWAIAFKELIHMLYSGQVPKWDLSKLRPAGAPLKTFGGRSSGPDPLDALFRFAVETFKGSMGRKLTSLECHDLVCKIGEVVVVGGVRRSALISLSNLSDDRMRQAKSGQWWENNGQRALANNSAVYSERPDFEVFLNEWLSLYKSKAGERGIFSRLASKTQVSRNGRRDVDYDFGTNPCSEIILRSSQLCNLSEVVIRPNDTLKTLMVKVVQATILGTLQSTLTDLRYVRPIWKLNTEEERLLGVSLTGIMDHPVLSQPSDKTRDWLDQLRLLAVSTNKKWAKKLGVEQSTAITCVKPSGTVSQLVDSASGIHARFAEHYIRRVRSDIKDPLTTMMIDQGVPHEVDVTNPSTVVFSFPQKVAEGAVVVADLDVKAQLDLWEVYQDHWCEHKPSVTIYYYDSEFLAAGQWVWDKLEKCSGISFLPRSDHIYAQAPYEEIDSKEYNKLIKQMPSIDWTKLGDYETIDMTTATQELSCTAGLCDI